MVSAARPENQGDCTSNAQKDNQKKKKEKVKRNDSHVIWNEGGGKKNQRDRLAWRGKEGGVE